MRVGLAVVFLRWGRGGHTQLAGGCVRLNRLLCEKAFADISRADRTDRYQSCVCISERVLEESRGNDGRKKKRQGLGCLGQSALMGLADDGGGSNNLPLQRLFRLP